MLAMPYVQSPMIQ